jgi:multiple sugar transport system ATP-binding protein
VPASVASGSSLLVGIRPEHVSRAGPGPAATGVAHVKAPIELLQPTGSRTFATFRLGGTPVLAELQAHDVSRPGEVVELAINLARASLFDATTEQALTPAR